MPRSTPQPEGSGAPRLLQRHAKLLKGRCRKPRVREALAYALAGDSVREAAARVGCHPSTLYEALERYALLGDWKRARKRRLRREHGGQVPPVWAHHFADVA